MPRELIWRKILIFFYDLMERYTEIVAELNCEYAGCNVKENKY